MRATHPITTKHGSFIALVMVITWLDFWRSSVGNCYFSKFSLKMMDVFFQGQTLFWPYLRNGCSDWCETFESALVGYWVWYVTLTFDLTLDLDLGSPMSNLKIAVSQEHLRDIGNGDQNKLLGQHFCSHNTTRIPAKFLPTSFPS